MAKAADRRRSAARAQGVSVETFRKGYEPVLVEQIAAEIVGLMSRREVGERAPTARTSEPEITADQPFSRERHVPDIVRTAHADVDWDLVEGIHRQCTATAGDRDSQYLPDALPSSLAKASGV
jgi:hypothetical protein